MVYLAEPNRKQVKASTKKRFKRKSKNRYRRTIRPDGAERLIARKRKASRRASKVTVVRDAHEAETAPNRGKRGTSGGRAGRCGAQAAAHAARKARAGGRATMFAVRELETRQRVQRHDATHACNTRVCIASCHAPPTLSHEIMHVGALAA